MFFVPLRSLHCCKSRWNMTLYTAEAIQLWSSLKQKQTAHFQGSPVVFKLKFAMGHGATTRNLRSKPCRP